MTKTELNQLLEGVRTGTVAVDAAVARLGEPAFGDLGFATLDLHRKERCGFPEVILAEGKTSAWIAGAVARISDANQDCFVTRLSMEQSDSLRVTFPTAEIDRVGRTFWLPTPGPKPEPVGDVLVITAGTGDLPVAQEAANTVRVMGVRVEMIVDVGVAGIHRILRHRERIAKADVLIVCAGMDGALPSVVGGLVDCPVIAVPTSIGYGASFGGVAALLTMLNSCSAGVVTVNIDAGFKAGTAAAQIAKRIARATSKPE